ncbi:preprotein translocase subunit SecG [Candidatus Microgenomates bacterium]|nr:preprotein translocase subunit SecG [Candidatus Microgenomates bacterium]
MLLFIQIVLAALIIISILMQSRGAGLGASLGGGGEFYSTRRGVERVIFRLTIILVVLFIATSLLIFLS